MSRALCIPAALLFFCALVLSLLTSISLPYLTGLDIARTSFSGSEIQNAQSLSQIRFGIWSSCRYFEGGDRTCTEASAGYNVTIAKLSSGATAVIDATWTRGLVVHPVATIAIALAFLFVLCSSSPIMGVISTVVGILAFLLTVIAFCVDIALFALVKMQFDDNFGTGVTTKTGPGFWLTFASLVLLLVGSCTVCFSCCRGRKRTDAAVPTGDTTETPTKKPLWGRFKRNQ